MLLVVLSLTSFQVQPKLIYFDIETRDEAGKIVPYCELNVVTTFDRNTYNFRTDKSGKCFFAVPVMAGKSSTVVRVEASTGTSMSYRQFDKLEDLNVGDTIKGIVTIYSTAKATRPKND